MLFTIAEMNEEFPWSTAAGFQTQKSYSMELQKVPSRFND
jgi:hypothetical protein